MSTSTANGVSAMEGIADASTSSSIGIETSAGQASTSTQQPPADDMTSRDYCAQQSTILRSWPCCAVLTLLLPCRFAPFRRGLVQVGEPPSHAPAAQANLTSVPYACHTQPLRLAMTLWRSLHARPPPN
jgi:hypothetical protein